MKNIHFKSKIHSLKKAKRMVVATKKSRKKTAIFLLLAILVVLVMLIIWHVLQPKDEKGNPTISFDPIGVIVGGSHSINTKAEESETKQEEKAETLSGTTITKPEEAARLSISDKPKKFIEWVSRRNTEAWEKCGQSCYRETVKVYRVAGDYVEISDAIYGKVIVGALPDQKAPKMLGEVTIDGVRMNILTTTASRCSDYDSMKIPTALRDMEQCKKNEEELDHFIKENKR